MRKTLIFTVLLALLAMGSIGYVAASIYPLRDQVTVWESESEGASCGDVSAADGLIATLKADYYTALNWHTKVYLGNDLPHTTTDYVLGTSVQKTTSYLRERNDIDIRITVEDVVDHSVFAYLTEGLEIGERREERIYLKEYADFFNIEVEILFPEVTYAWRPSDTTVGNETETALKALFDENFRFPIGENVSVVGHGDVSQYGPGYGYGVNASSETFGLDVKQVFCGDSAYFTFNRNAEGYRNLDVSYLPQGYGIYCVTVPEDGGQPTLRNVYTLDPATEILKLALDEAGNVLAYIVENGILSVAVIDPTTNALRQQVELVDFPGGSSVWAAYEADNAIAITLEAENYRIVLLTKGTDGLYQLHWNLSIPSANAYLLHHQDVSLSNYRYDFSPVMAWNGTYLAFGISTEYRSGFELALYEENGLAYSGKYLTSLNIWPIEPDGDVPLTLEWESTNNSLNPNLAKEG